MKITINKKIEKQKISAIFVNKQFQNQQPNYKQPNKYDITQRKVQGQQYQQCGKWLFQKCLRKPSNVTEQEPQNHCLALAYTNVSYHQLKSKSTLKKNRNSCKRPLKINIFSIKSKSVTKNNECNKYPSLVNSKNATGVTLTKQVYLQGKSDLLQTKQCTQAQKSHQNSNKNSTNKLKSKLLDFSIKPSTIISSKNLQQSKQNKPMCLSDNFNSIVSKEIIPFSINDISELSYERIYTERIKKTEQKCQDFNLEGFSRFQLIQMEDYSGRQKEGGSDHSITTNDLKKKIHFSEQKSPRSKMEDCLYQPLYIIGNPQTPQSQMKKHHSHSHKSQLIKAIQVEDEKYFDSNKLNSDQSVVLQKGLEEIFSPKLNGDAGEDNWSGYFMSYSGLDRIVED